MGSLLLGIGKPYFDLKVTPNYIIRLFPFWVDSRKLKWHMDDEDRKVVVLFNEGWTYQNDNKLPFFLKKTIFIKKHTWHRIIKGNGSLLLKIYLNGKSNS